LLANGNLKQALSLEWEEVQSQRKKALHLFLALHKRERAADLLKQFSASRAVIKEELETTLEILASLCRDVVLIKEKAEAGFLMNPDFEQEIGKVAQSVSLVQAMDFLAKIDFAIDALRKNLNVNILVSSIFSNFLEWSHV
jgi:DNA polymerase-3 subunit delta'